MSIKIGKFGFVNNYLPYYQLEQNGMQIIAALPKQLAGMFETGEIDFAPFLRSENLSNLVVS